jgi:Predicted SAM-dependent methyltransferases
MYTRIELKSQKERPIERGHNWVFSGAIKGKINIETGTLVDVYSSRDAFLGTGHYSNGSIAVRLISKTRQAIDFVFWKKNFEKAWAIRSLLALKKRANKLLPTDPWRRRRLTRANH